MAETSPVVLVPDSPDVPLADLEEEDGAQSEPIDVPDDPQEEAEEETQEAGIRSEGELNKEGTKRGKAVFDVTRRPGKTHLPIARVQKVLKADRVNFLANLWETYRNPDFETHAGAAYCRPRGSIRYRCGHRRVYDTTGSCSRAHGAKGEPNDSSI